MERDLPTTLSEEAERAGARIDRSRGQLATKLRRRADKAKAACTAAPRGLAGERLAPVPEQVSPHAASIRGRV